MQVSLFFIFLPYLRKTIDVSPFSTFFLFTCEYLPSFVFLLFAYFLPFIFGEPKICKITPKNYSSKTIAVPFQPHKTAVDLFFMIFFLLFCVFVQNRFTSDSVCFWFHSIFIHFKRFYIFPCFLRFHFQLKHSIKNVFFFKRLHFYVMHSFCFHLHIPVRLSRRTQ